MSQAGIVKTVGCRTPLPHTKHEGLSMKNIILLAFGALALLPLSASAGGAHTPGYVSIDTDATQTSMSGTFNVRYNTDPAVGNAYITAQGNDGVVIFLAQSNDGIGFICTLYPGDPLFEKAVAVRNNLKNGSRLSVSRDLGTSKCNTPVIQSYSQYQD